MGPTAIDLLNEAQLLDHIKSIAVKGENYAVHRQEFDALRQVVEVLMRENRTEYARHLVTSFITESLADRY